MENGQIKLFIILKIIISCTNPKRKQVRELETCKNQSRTSSGVGKILNILNNVAKEFNTPYAKSWVANAILLFYFISLQLKL